MKLFIQIVETAHTNRIPEWFVSGDLVDIADDSVAPDAPYILEPEEYDYEWRRCDVPSEIFAGVVGHSFDEWFSNIKRFGEEDETQRVENINNWIRNDPYQKLSSRPLIMTFNPITLKLTLLDGHHRIALAIHRYNLDKIPCVVAMA